MRRGRGRCEESACRRRPRHRGRRRRRRRPRAVRPEAARRGGAAEAWQPRRGVPPSRRSLTPMAAVEVEPAEPRRAPRELSPTAERVRPSSPNPSPRPRPPSRRQCPSQNRCRQRPTPPRTDPARTVQAQPAVPLVGLTGGMGAGKSTALAALERLGAATLSTDAVVHELYAGDERLREAVVERWGPEVAPGGVVDRAAVARRAFADEGGAPLAGGPAVAAGRRAGGASGSTEARARAAGAAGGRGRGAAAVRGRDGGAVRRDGGGASRRRSCAASEPPRAGTSCRASAPRDSSPRRRRRDARRSRCATTAANRSWRGSCRRFLTS